MCHIYASAVKREGRAACLPRRGTSHQSATARSTCSTSENRAQDVSSPRRAMASSSTCGSCTSKGRPCMRVGVGSRTRPQQTGSGGARRHARRCRCEICFTGHTTAGCESTHGADLRLSHRKFAHDAHAIGLKQSPLGAVLAKIHSIVLACRGATAGLPQQLWDLLCAPTAALARLADREW